MGAINHTVRALSACAMILLVVLPAVPQQKQARQRPDADPLEGTWECLARGLDGKVYRGGMVTQFAFQKGKLTTKPPWVQNGTATYEVRPHLTPSEIDVIHVGKAGTTAVFPGIYQCSGDRMTWCYAWKSDDRPTALETKEGDGRLLLTLQREESKPGVADQETPKVSHPTKTENVKHPTQRFVGGGWVACGHRPFQLRSRFLSGRRRGRLARP
ncbi:MAG: TIGR03067 domain-containing protein [Planctomycetota bacterium]|jgi:uncharacterized protein (TIGR03067 family)